MSGQRPRFPRKAPARAIAALLASLIPHFHITAATVSLRPVADTSIHELNPANNMGGHTHFSAGSTGHAASRSRGLFQFGFQGLVPTNAVINSASLSLQVTGTPSTGGANSDFSLHRLLQPWGEGNKVGNLGAAASPDEATWNARFAPATLWTLSGGEAGNDYVAQESGSIFVSGINRYIFPSTLVADVQAWVANPSTNFGWILISQSEEISQTARRFGSREDTNNAPLLELDYSVPTATQPQISGLNLAADKVTFQFNAEAGRIYSIEFTPTLSPPAWQVVSNFPAPPVNTNFQMSDAIIAGQRFYRVRAP